LTELHIEIDKIRPFG